MPNKRTAFFVSDRTGITAEMLGHSLLAQFPGLQFDMVTLPFVDTVDKALAAREKIRQAERQGPRPLIFSSLADPEIRAIVAACNALTLDVFEAFSAMLEVELETEASHAAGRFRGTDDEAVFKQRMDAINFTMAHDDGASTRDFQHADIILVGVSRTGKTPTCLYLALQYGIRAANYPLTTEDFDEPQLPAALRPYRAKLYGLTTGPERLHQIRQARKPDSNYASLRACQYEIRQAEALFRAHTIPFLDSTDQSIEEIASAILHEAKLERRLR